MYEARQQKEKMGRRIDVGDGVKQRVKVDDRRINSTSARNIKQLKSMGKVYLKMSQSIQPIQCVVLTRSMQKVVDETIFFTNEDVELFKNTFRCRYNENIVNEMIGRIIYNQNENDGYVNDFDENEIDNNEFGANITYHGDLDEYDDPHEIDQFIGDSTIQMARKGNTVSGPKTYQGTQGPYVDISYKTGEKGDIDFRYPSNGCIYGNTVLEDSFVDLGQGGVTIDTKNRLQHFAIADKLYSNKKGWETASLSTNNRKGKYTWHHMVTPYLMVLVDMEVHRKHGHNGGVYLW